jgi:hypothetical protein
LISFFFFFLSINENRRCESNQSKQTQTADIDKNNPPIASIGLDLLENPAVWSCVPIRCSFWKLEILYAPQTEKGESSSPQSKRKKILTQKK